MKVDGVLYIKPSGVPLATLAAGARPARHRRCSLALLDATPDRRCGRRARPGDARRRRPPGSRTPADGGPSVELLFHALLPRAVRPAHPPDRDQRGHLQRRRRGAARSACSATEVALGAVHGSRACRSPARSRTARAAFAASAPAAAARASRCSQNHGLIVAGDTRRGDRRRVRVAGRDRPGRRRRDLRPRRPSAGDPSMPARAAAARGRRRRRRCGRLLGGRRPAARSSRSTTPRSPPRFTATAAGRAFVHGGPLTPDQIVYAGSFPLLLDCRRRGARRRARATLAAAPRRARRRPTAATPIIVVVPGLGLFAAGDTWAQADTARHIYLDALRVGAGAVARRRPPPGGRRARLHRELGGRGVPQADRRGRPPDAGPGSRARSPS